MCNIFIHFITGLYTLLGASTLFALSKEYYVWNADSWYTVYLVIALVTLNKMAGPTIRQFFEDTRVVSNRWY